MSSPAGRLLRAGVLVVGPLSGWSVYASNKRREAPKHTRFAAGSVEEMVSNRLKTGDLIFFRRNPVLMQPPFALLCLAGRKVLGEPQAENPDKSDENAGGAEEYDHVGAIVKDRFGTPHVLEVTFRGVRLRRFDERIAWSKSDEITCVPLNKPLSDGLRQKADRWARSLTPERTMKFDSPWTGLEFELLGLVKYFLYGRAENDKPPDFMGEPLLSSRRAALVLGLFDKLELVDWPEPQAEKEEKKVGKDADTGAKEEGRRKMPPPQYITPMDLFRGNLDLKDGYALDLREPVAIRIRE